MREGTASKKRSTRCRVLRAGYESGGGMGVGVGSSPSAW